MRAIDLFAGLGGNSEGARQAGVSVVWAANHWQSAVEVHAANHPDTQHLVQDLHQAFCEGRGWTVEPAKGGYEALRMRHPDRKDPLIVHDRDGANEHYTTWGESARMVSAMLRARKKGEKHVHL